MLKKLKPNKYVITRVKAIGFIHEKEKPPKKYFTRERLQISIHIKGRIGYVDGINIPMSKPCTRACKSNKDFCFRKTLNRTSVSIEVKIAIAMSMRDL
jgi:hypothetical protein